MTGPVEQVASYDGTTLDFTELLSDPFFHKCLCKQSACLSVAVEVNQTPECNVLDE